MSNNNYQTYLDFGFSKLRAGAFNKVNLNESFHTESKFFFDQTEIDKEIQKIITFLEKKTNEYINDINLMIDSSEMQSIGISISKKIDETPLRQKDIQFLIQEAKQQISKHYYDQNIVHIIINNYKINDVDYSYLPKDIKGNFISLDILFICIPEKIIKHFHNIFFKFNISINQIISSNYTKAINYKNEFYLYKNISFVDIGFNKTSIITYIDNKIISLNVLPIGGNHITKDISKVLKVEIKQAENLKINFKKDDIFLNNRDYSSELLQKIINARTEEILDLCVQSIKLNFTTMNLHKIVLTGEGSKIFENQYEDKISGVKDIVFFEETTHDICKSGFKLGMGLNKQEVVVVPKIQIKQGFFEKLFHFFN